MSSAKYCIGKLTLITNCGSRWQLAQQPGAVSGLPLIISMMPPPRVRAVQRAQAAQAAQAHHNLPLLSARPGNEWRRDTAPAAAGLLAP